MTNLLYRTFTSPFKNYTFVWKETGKMVKIQRIFLSNAKLSSENKAFEVFKQIKLGGSHSIELLNEKVQNFLKGGDIQFELDSLDFSVCLEFQKRVLLAENKIPRGYISTYKRIAIHLGIQNGARAVGNALANNPFPIFIPCHRAIKSNGELGGFQGGLSMKKSLLELEGIKISPNGSVLMTQIFY